MLKYLLLALVLSGSLGAQSRVPGFNVVLDPDGTRRLWTTMLFNNKPAVFVLGAGGEFLEFLDPSKLPSSTLRGKLELAAWGVLDTRSCAPQSLAGIKELNYCSVNSNLFYCTGATSYLAEDTVPATGFVWPAEVPTTAPVLDWHKPLNPYAVTSSPIRYDVTYCGPKGCLSNCSKGLLYTHPSEPQTFGAVFYLR